MSRTRYKMNLKNQMIQQKILFEKKNIHHITHDFGGGTEIYIKNMTEIFPNYKHTILKIKGNSHFQASPELIPFEKLNELLVEKSVVFVHNLISLDADGLKINQRVLDFLINNNVTLKVLIIHDYYLFFPHDPNPIKSRNEIPTVENIEKAKLIIGNFEKVIFNSENCYLNHLKYLKTIPNSMVLNNVPDLDFYHERVFPPLRNSYKIALIGHLRCEHKGKFLAQKIIESFIGNSKYNFIIFGESDLNAPNCVNHGPFHNKDIFKLFNQYQIDYFLFVSVFEETYSFALSCALKSGLPIIYNNIGSYTERLSNYDNCYSFVEYDYMKIHSILQKIEPYHSELIPLNDNYVFYNNIPELSDYLCHPNLNFHLDTIEKNLIHKNVCFIHFCNMESKDILLDQLQTIKSSGLYDNLDYIFITMLGTYTKIPNDFKIKLIYYSQDTQEWEFPNYKRIKHFCDTIPYNVNILEIHTKGVLKKNFALEWRKYLEYFLIEKHSLCLSLLANFKCVGVNQYFYFDAKNKYKNHFSGNFWWARSDYIKTLPLVETTPDRYSVEHWLIGNLEKNDYRYFFSLHQSDQDLYQTPLLPIHYNLEIIKSRVIQKLSTNFVKQCPIYGVYFICCKGNYLEIIQSQLEKLTSSGLYNHTDLLLCFVTCQTDESIQLLKKFEKIKIISTTENLYEKYAINGFKLHLSGEYKLYYIHSKGVSKTESCIDDWRTLCDYFTINQWRISVELLDYYDCVGTNLKNFPKKHYSGNFWWANSKHLEKLRNINDSYLAPEMYVYSYPKTNGISIYQSYVNHGGAPYPKEYYTYKSKEELVNNITMIPDFNFGDKICISMCGDLDLNHEPPILQ